ncbi:MAG TPA: hypothetical protein VH158_05225, partial [Gemmatimonadales bacterium]|nr:hypothetical protein [Gemmatimonadales bacterium]
MATDTAGVDHALGALGTTFRLTRLYPPTHPAVMEALRQIGEALPALAALGTVEWKVGATGVHWRGQQLLPRNNQIAQLAGLLYAHGVRTLTLNPGMTAENLLALFGVATGGIPPDDAALGRLTVGLGRRSTARLERLRTATPATGVHALPETAPEGAGPGSGAGASAPPAPHEVGSGKPPTTVLRHDVLPPGVEAKRVIAALKTAPVPEEQRAAVERLAALAPDLLAHRDATTVADAIATLDLLLARAAADPGLVQAI